MRLFPDARREEFEQVVEAARLGAGMIVGDVPAGGSYLRNYIPENCVWQGHEPCASFTNHGSLETTKSIPLLPLPWQDNSIDAVISLAGVHHLDDKVALFSEINRVTKPSGRFVLSDVRAGSNIARFLDGYIGDHNSTGHEGIYLDEQTEVELANSGWLVDGFMQRHYHWVFESQEYMAMFCHCLFDLRGSDVNATREAIINQLGVVTRDDGRVGMNWSLLTISATKI